MNTTFDAPRAASFHDGFVFHGHKRLQLKQLRIAVLPLMALAVARVAKRVLRLVNSDSPRRA